MKTYAFVTRPDELSNRVSDEIKAVLTAHGYTETDRIPDTVFVVGGDGTFIYAVHQYEDYLDRVSFYGIHTGTLGFYTDWKDNELDGFLNAFLSNHIKEIRYPLIETKTNTGTFYAINEMRIENAARTQTMEIYIDGEHFETYRGTGVCVSTQLGSTAYNRSLRGAVVQEGLDILQLCEISGIHHSKYLSLGSPLVLKGSTTLVFEAEHFDGALLGHDNEVQAMEGVNRVSVSISKDRYVRMLRGRQVSYFQRLKSLF